MQDVMINQFFESIFIGDLNTYVHIISLVIHSSTIVVYKYAYVRLCLVKWIIFQGTVIDEISVRDGDKEAQPPRNLRLTLLDGENVFMM